MKMIWIASYPKSGNTWLRFMLYSAIFGAPEHSIDISRKIPDLHRKMPFDQPESDTMYMKTHFELSDQHPALNQSFKAIHIVRNPRDVLLSALNYRQLSDDENAQRSSIEYAKSFIQSQGDRAWAQMGFGTWVSHTRSWINNDRFPVLNLRYEQLRKDPRAGLVDMLKFLDVERTDQQIDDAIRASSFDQMRALEIREKNSTKSDDLTKRLFVGTQRAAKKGKYFMNGGKSNQSLNQISQGLDELFDDRFQEALNEFNYND